MLDLNKFCAEMLEIMEAYKRFKIVEEYFNNNEVLDKKKFKELFEVELDIME